MVQSKVDCSTLPNERRRAYSIGQITTATLELLESHALEDLSIGEIVTAAQVSRNSFYRNFADKPAIIKAHLAHLLEGWSGLQMPSGQEMQLSHYEELFKIINAEHALFRLLHRRGLLPLLLPVLQELLPLDDKLPPMIGYVRSFFLHGLFGWVHQWVQRDFVETVDEMIALLKAAGHH